MRCVLAQCAAAVTFLLAVSTGAAQAEPPRLISHGSFNSPGAFGVAIDQSSGDVYVAGLINLSTFEREHVNKFDPSGGPISPPSPFGEAFYSGTAVNPVNGDVYVVGEAGPELFATPATVYSYDPITGAPVSTPFEVPSSRGLTSFLTTVQIAADSSGNVYVPVISENEVLEYSPTGTLLHTFTGSGAAALREPTGVAVDSSGNLWIADHTNNRIEELDPAGVLVGTIASEGVLWVALDGHGHVFAIVENSADGCGSIGPPCAHLIEYGAAGEQLVDIGAGSFGRKEGHPSLSMLAVDESSGNVYVTDAYNNRFWIFAPPSAPTVGKEFSAEVSTSEAKLGALVNAGGLQTTYRFEYGTTTAYGRSTPAPEGSVGEGVSGHAVWASASGLEPGTTYHYRVVATNELANMGVAGPDQTFTTQTAEQAACPNEQLRGGFSARLPDCRAYELVTAPTKTSAQVKAPEGAAADGNAIAFNTHEPLPGEPAAGDFYVATRGGGGWTSEGVIPLEAYTGLLCTTQANSVRSYSSELSKALIELGHDARASDPEDIEHEEHECGAEGLQVVPGEPVGYQNLLLRDNATGTYRLINAPPPGVTPADAHFDGASTDLSHVVFSEFAPLTPDAPAGVKDLYEWDEGALRLLTVLPDGTPVSGSLPPGQDGLNGGHAISADGSHIAFEAGGDLYLRLDGSGTVQLDAPQSGAAGGGGKFWAASTDGSRVFFTDENRLTTDSTAQPGEPDLYECVIVEIHESGTLKPRCDLSDLTVVATGEHADVSRVSSVAQDGSDVYFVAGGVLASNGREYTSAEGQAVIEKAASGERNLYLWHDGAITFIATLGAGDPGTATNSPDGNWLAFASQKSLTGYDNTDSEDRQDEEVFLYDAASGQLVCASCDPTGETPIPLGGATLAIGATAPRYLADSGRLFFDTAEALVPSDTNHQVDVYEYEGGELHLISGGTGANASEFIDSSVGEHPASEGGNNVFFLTRQRLVPEDTEEEVHVIYDARVGGGFPSEASPPPCATTDSCRTPVSSQPAIYGAPSSQSFSGAGNLVPLPAASTPRPQPKPVKCKKGFVRKKVDQKTVRVKKKVKGKIIFVKEKVGGRTICARKPARKARNAGHARAKGD
jgi:hypothetical protein